MVEAGLWADISYHFLVGHFETQGHVISLIF